MKEKTEEKVWGMGWYKFQIWFALFASVILDTYSGIEILTGKVYELGGVTAAAARAAHGGWLGALDIVTGIIVLLMAAFAVVTRHKLAKFEKAGIECIHLLHYIDLAASLIYHIVLSVALGAFCADAGTILEQLATVVMIIVNKPYFEHREHMFH